MSSNARGADVMIKCDSGFANPGGEPESPKDRFLRFCPEGFRDPKYLEFERDYKWAAHQEWNELLNEQEFVRLLDEDDWKEIARRALRIEAKTKKLISPFEKAALGDAVKDEKPARLFVNGLYDLVYGDDPFEKRLREFRPILRNCLATPRRPSSGRSPRSSRSLRCRRSISISSRP